MVIAAAARSKGVTPEQDGVEFSTFIGGNNGREPAIEAHGVFVRSLWMAAVGANKSAQAQKKFSCELPRFYSLGRGKS